MNSENTELIEQTTKILYEYEALLSDAQKIKTIELYNQLRSKIVKIYSKYFEAKYCF